jgi:GT2 family glycosyltransferase
MSLVSKPSVAVIVLNYNSADFLKPIVFKSIESALRINFSNFEVIVVDNCSTDGSFEAIEDRFGKDILALRLNQNYGYAGGNELGFQGYASRRGVPDYVIFMNNDYVVRNEDFLRDMVSFLEGRENILLANGYNLEEDGRRVGNAGAFIDSFADVILRYSGHKISECPKDPSYVTYAPGECFIARVRPILELRRHIFSPKIFGYWDETELALSLWTYGFRSVTIPMEVGIHYGSKSFSKFSNLAQYLFVRNKHAIIKSYFRGRLKIYSRPATFNFLLTFPRRPFQDTKGKILTRAFFDSYKIFFSSFGKFNPAIIVPKKISLYVKYVLPFPRRIFQRLLEKISLMTISDEELKSSPIPFAIPVNY